MSAMARFERRVALLFFVGALAAGLAAWIATTRVRRAALPNVGESQAGGGGGAEASVRRRGIGRESEEELRREKEGHREGIGGA